PLRSANRCTPSHTPVPALFSVRPSNSAKPLTARAAPGSTLMAPPPVMVPSQLNLLVTLIESAPDSVPPASSSVGTVTGAPGSNVAWPVMWTVLPRLAIGWVNVTEPPNWPTDVAPATLYVPASATCPPANETCPPPAMLDVGPSANAPPANSSVA